MIYKWKCVILGDPAVGKTSLVRHYCDGYFQESYLTTIGVSFMRKEINYKDSTVVLQLWDIGGQAMFSSVRSNYLKGTHAAMIMFDLTRKGTLVSVNRWYEDVVRVAKQIPVILVANKSDLPHNPGLIKKAEKIAERWNCELIITSAKTGDHMNEAFKTMTREIFETHEI